MSCVDITPYSISEPIKSSNIISLNYTNQDFWSMKSRLVDFISQRFGDEFSDFVESSLAIMLIENWSFIADTLSFKIDQIANEIFIDTVTELDNAFRIAKLVGFQAQPPIASSSLWTAFINAPLTFDLVIPTPYLVTVSSNSGSIPIELFPADANNNAILNEDIIISAGSLENQSVIGLQGQTTEFQASADGSMFQNYSLTQTPIIFDSINVFINGTQWQQVEYFTESSPKKEFRVEYNSDWSAVVIFGDSKAGLIPNQGSEVLITYRVGGGVLGNMVSGQTGTANITVTEFPYAVPVNFQSYTPGNYGYDGDTIDDIRRKLPQYLRTQDRAVTGTDYKTLADQFSTPYQGQIGKSIASLRNYGGAANIIDVYVLALVAPNNLMLASDELKLELLNSLNESKMITDWVCVRDGTILEVDAHIDLSVSRTQRKFEDEIKAKINRRIANFFALVNWEYGQNLKDSDIIKILSDVNEIQDLNITFTTNDPDNTGQIITTKFNEIIRLDNTYLSINYI